MKGAEFRILYVNGMQSTVKFDALELEVNKCCSILSYNMC